MFISKLEHLWSEKKFLCVGLDPELTKIPQSVKTENIVDSLVTFNKAIIDATADIVCAFKPNAAFYEAYGADGFTALQQTIAYIKETHPEIPVIFDAKRGDIGNTNNGYATSAFDYFQADALTVQPYLGKEANEVFLNRKDKGIIVLVKTSNKGSGEFQDMLVGDEKTPLYQLIAKNIADNWNTNGNCAIVVGATYPEELKKVREIVGDLPILIPGVGAQGGDLTASVQNGKNSKGTGIIISTSRAVLYASNDVNYAQAAREEAEHLHNEIKESL